MSVSGGPQSVLATRRFTTADQQAFAAVSGDFNPLHMDPAWAATVFPGEVVVHGAHVALWGCDAYFAKNPVRKLRGLKVAFDKPILLNEDVTAGTEELADGVRIAFYVRGVKLMTATLRFSDGSMNSLPPPLNPEAPRLMARHMSDVNGLSGVVTLSHAARGLAQMFPAFTSASSAAAPVGIAALSSLVGMECPGLHGLFSSFDVELTGAAGALSYKVIKADNRFNRVEMEVSGYALAGKVAAFLTAGPAAEKPAATAVEPSEFKHQQPLVIGASSGLGRATTLILAAGGAEPIGTYRASRAAIEALTAEIGGKFVALPYDTRAPGALVAELAARGWDGAEVYFFATPRIFRRRLEARDPALLQEFTAIYVDGFNNLVRALVKTFPDRAFRVFYPSSILAAAPKTESVEYAEAKRAGEQLCAALQVEFPHLKIHAERLPGINTRQTVTITPATTLPAEEVMLPLIRALQAHVDVIPPPPNVADSK